MKDYKLIGGKKQLQNEIQLLNKEAKRIDRQIDKTLNEVGVTDIRDFRTRCRELKMIKDNYEQDKKRFKEAKLNHEERVREYMADVKDSNVEIYEREKKYVRSR